MENNGKMVANGGIHAYLKWSGWIEKMVENGGFWWFFKGKW